MIYVKRDPTLIPGPVLKVAERAQSQLEALPANERAAFIKAKSHVWRAFARYLSKMSYGKCWYSESPDPQSFFDVDHFRPKLEAIRSDSEKDEGYPWLAFSPENFRYTASRSNRPSKNEDTEELDGKGSWFPLLQGSPKASWDDRCIADEKPVLLDPEKPADVRLIDITADGRADASRFCLGANKKRVEVSCKCFGLNLPRLVSARKRAMRSVQVLVDTYVAAAEQAAQFPAMENNAAFAPLLNELQNKTHPQEPYCLAARAQLRLAGLGELCLTPEAV